MGTKKSKKSSMPSEPKDPATKGRSASKATWKLLDRGSIITAGILAPQVAAASWRAATGRKPPTVSRNPEVDTREAIAWAIVGGALVELIKVLVRRWAAEYWVKSTGDLPPGMKHIKPVAPPEPVPEPEPTKRRRRR